MEQQSGRQVLDWNDPDIDWQGDGGARGLRGIAIHADRVYVAADDRVLVLSPDFKQQAVLENPYLQHSHALCVWRDTLYVCSSGYDSVLGFDLRAQQFTWAMHVKSLRHRFLPSAFDPLAEDGPLMLQKLHLNQIVCNENGMYLTGLRTHGMLHFNGEAVNMAVQLPVGSRDARPFRDGVIFNDSANSALRYTGRGEGEEDRALKIPANSTSGFARGLCVLSDALVAAGSAPATIALYDLPGNRLLGSVQLSANPNTSIHTIAAWQETLPA